MTSWHNPPFDLPCILHINCLFVVLCCYLFLYARLQTGRIMVWWCPSVRVSVRPSVTVFRTFLLHADILIRNFVYHFIVMHVRSSSNVINFRRFLQKLCSFLTSNSYKYAVFTHFSPTYFNILSSNFVYGFV